MGRFSVTFVLLVPRVAPPCPSTGTRCDRRSPAFHGACARGGGVRRSFYVLLHVCAMCPTYFCTDLIPMPPAGDYSTSRLTPPHHFLHEDPKPADAPLPSIPEPSPPALITEDEKPVSSAVKTKLLCVHAIRRILGTKLSVSQLQHETELQPVLKQGSPTNPNLMSAFHNPTRLLETQSSHGDHAAHGPAFAHIERPAEVQLDVQAHVEEQAHNDASPHFEAKCIAEGQGPTEVKPGRNTSIRVELHRYPTRLNKVTTEFNNMPSPGIGFPTAECTDSPISGWAGADRSPDSLTTAAGGLQSTDTGPGCGE